MNIWIESIVFLAFIACVLFVGFYMGRSKKKPEGEENAEDYFLAGRGLSWWLIGFSLIAANISAEQFVGMSGQGAGLQGLSCASWEWIAAIALVVVAFCFLPYFLKTGITTMPEFLEKRYNHQARTLMTVSMIGILIMASLIGVTYAGSIVMYDMFNQFGVGINRSTCCIIMSVIAAAYVLFGGLKACAWADLLQGAALIVGGAIIAYYACDALADAPAETLTGFRGATTTSSGFLDRFMDLNASKMEMGRPATDDAMPWTILIMGIWIPNFYYWGLNQYITQRILGSGSLAEGQKGIVLAAGLKLIIPFIIVIPGVIAFNLYAGDMAGDTAKEMAKAKYKDNELVLFYSTKADLATAEMSEKAIREKLDDTVEAKIDEHNAPLLKRIEETKGKPTIENIKAWDAQGKKGEIELNDGSSIKVVENTYMYDNALSKLMKKISETPGVLGFVLAALLGAIVSSLAAVLNAVSTLFTMDIFQRYIKPDAKPSLLVFTGRVVTVVLTVIGCVAAAMLNSKSIFDYIQNVQCYVSPAIFAVFVFGILNRTANRWAGLFGLLVGPVLFTVFDIWGWDLFPVCIREMMAPWGLGVPVEGGTMHFLNAASWTLVLTLILLYVYGLIFKMPKQDKVEFQANTTLNMTMSKGALIAGIIVCVLTVALYVFFW